MSPNNHVIDKEAFRKQIKIIDFFKNENPRPVYWTAL